ncbi:hypothetical protein CIHG_08630 [Coccidioides immitis H538.4]|uniref:Uncharacterized protein n=3 Tax=Coccidioides immitis TaxID=5501 RepID=A0A0J8U3L9_COCIT|nr:hypothetical protein CIRG_09829 [Coccidioides immitis RMSCC 2394]KMU81412.1 hypothetical protein CISG_09125 [Coccidioides immitis RMSCC 3703]KMU90826.1 hypothetical protein CIHG_08630 [Coccidioides immitis H538.4]
MGKLQPPRGKSTSIIHAQQATSSEKITHEDLLSSEAKQRRHQQSAQLAMRREKSITKTRSRRPEANGGGVFGGCGARKVPRANPWPAVSRKTWHEMTALPLGQGEIAPWSSWSRRSTPACSPAPVPAHSFALLESSRLHLPSARIPLGDPSPDCCRISIPSAAGRSLGSSMETNHRPQPMLDPIHRRSIHVVPLLLQRRPKFEFCNGTTSHRPKRKQLKRANPCWASMTPRLVFQNALTSSLCCRCQVFVFIFIFIFLCLLLNGLGVFAPFRGGPMLDDRARVQVRRMPRQIIPKPSVSGISTTLASRLPHLQRLSPGLIPVDRMPGIERITAFQAKHPEKWCCCQDS